MAVKVVDASAVAALLFNEPDSDLVAEHFRTGRLFAPALLSLELANICLKKMRRDGTRAREWQAAFAFRTALRIREEPVDPDATLALALATSLTAYDASYLWLARHLGAELVTLDRQLARAAV